MNNSDPGSQVITGCHQAPIFATPRSNTKGLTLYLRTCHGFAQAGSALLQTNSFSSAPNIFGTGEAGMTWTPEKSPCHKSPWADGRSCAGIPWLFPGPALTGNTRLRKLWSLACFPADLQFLSYWNRKFTEMLSCPWRGGVPKFGRPWKMSCWELKPNK